MKLTTRFWRQAGLCLASALLLILSHPPYHYWGFAWIALVPLLSVIDGLSSRQAFRWGYLFGLCYCFGMFWWFVHVTLPGMILLNSFLALYFACMTATATLVRGKTLARQAMLIACAWVCWEFLRSRLLSGFGWAGLGHSQYQRLMLIQAADIVGVYGISFVLVMVNVWCYQMLKCRDSRWRNPPLRRLGLLAAGLLAAVCFYGAGVIHFAGGARHKAGSVRIGLVQPNIHQRDKWDPARRRDILEQLRILSLEAARDQPALIVWPESALPGAPDDLETDLQVVAGVARQTGIPVMAGYVRRDGQRYYNSAGLFSAGGVLTAQYDKIHLVPFGEFVPLRRVFPFLSSIVPVDDMSPGKAPVVFTLDGPGGPVRLSALICFEDTVDRVPRDMVRAGAEIFVNMTNDAWFRDTKAPWLHLQAAVFQAVSYKRPLVRSANTGVSASVSALGEIRDVMRAHDGKAVFRSGFLITDVTAGTGQTWRSRFGDIFAYLCIATLVLNVMINQKKAGFPDIYPKGESR